MQIADLRAALEALQTRALTYPEVDHLVRTFHALALAYVGRKVHAGKLETNRLGISLDDLAVDCIADLFARDDRGTFPSLHSYFADVTLDSLSDPEVLGLCRRLVFSAVNQQLFRIFGSYDPAFRKLLRNLKGAARRIPGVQLVEHQGDAWLLFSANGARITARPVMPPEFLEMHLARSLSVRSSATDMLRSVGEVLVDQPGFARAYPLLGLASVLRQMLVRMGVVEEPEQQDGISTAEIDKVLKQLLPEVVSAVGMRYLRDGKLQPALLDAYQDAVREILLMEFGDGNGRDVSFCDILTTKIPGLTPAGYASEHRSRLEYLVRLSRLRFLETMEEQL